METYATVPGDTPLSSVPSDYAAGGDSRWFVLPAGPDAGKKLFFLDKRMSDGDGPVVLFVHGNPECSYTYRKVISALARSSLPRGTRVIAMDHIGFGLSDQASYEMVDMHHADNLAQLVRTLDLRDITLVVHDWGGAIGVGALLRSPERVSNLVVINSSVFPVPQDDMTYGNWPKPIPWVRSASLVPDRLWGAHAAATVMHGAVGTGRLLARYSRLMLPHLVGRLPREEQEAHGVYRHQFDSKANARSSKRMVRQSPILGHGYAYDDPQLGRQDNHTFYQDMQRRIGPQWGPDGQAIGVAGIFGTWDPLGKASVVEQWLDTLPQMQEHLQAFPHEGHFMAERRPDVVAEAITSLNPTSA